MFEKKDTWAVSKVTRLNNRKNNKVDLEKLFYFRRNILSFNIISRTVSIKEKSLTIDKKIENMEF